jgi:hypothetical protein
MQKTVVNTEVTVIGGHHTMSQDRTSKPEIPLLLTTARYESQDEKRDRSSNNLGQLLVCPPTRITRKNPKKPRRENMSQENHYESIHGAEGKSIPVVVNGKMCTKMIKHLVLSINIRS